MHRLHEIYESIYYDFYYIMHKPIKGHKTFLIYYLMNFLNSVSINNELCVLFFDLKINENKFA